MSLTYIINTFLFDIADFACGAVLVLLHVGSIHAYV